jgi:hypothetical protein
MKAYLSDDVILIKGVFKCEIVFEEGSDRGLGTKTRARELVSH